MDFDKNKNERERSPTEHHSVIVAAELASRVKKRPSVAEAVAHRKDADEEGVNTQSDLTRIPSPSIPKTDYSHSSVRSLANSSKSIRGSDFTSPMAGSMPYIPLGLLSSTTQMYGQLSSESNNVKSSVGSDSPRSVCALANSSTVPRSPRRSLTSPHTGRSIRAVEMSGYTPRSRTSGVMTAAMDSVSICAMKERSNSMGGDMSSAISAAAAAAAERDAFSRGASSRAGRDSAPPMTPLNAGLQSVSRLTTPDLIGSDEGSPRPQPIRRSSARFPNTTVCVPSPMTRRHSSSVFRDDPRADAQLGGMRVVPSIPQISGPTIQTGTLPRGCQGRDEVKPLHSIGRKTSSDYTTHLVSEASLKFFNA
mmetsp:Transcript_18341/g.18427  ORF Transcript_18341/g.18427 Transcript_18341/m.18427 type:complete len:365 (-) Transcript_18341:608-1702(-)|eukprot:CAMPEP_0182420528 /NCGR_PEP_ID=MMETSP1167-20130531/5384_1 /TAXON_ID=2988 /ORGANISM="Mallomonas Sp, Strain CCMP3275" /LENGTH=364 /DNA_ID=CAMNT_0024596579 /DNA_START=112 /DNA_END=1206 /DNA_ORIENTATION=+